MAENEVSKEEYKKMNKEDPEQWFATRLLQVGIPEPEREYKFHPDRNWRADFAWPSFLLLVEIQGGTWSGGRHVRGKGYAEDCEKLNMAQAYGWEMLWFTSDQVRDDTAIQFMLDYVFTTL